jgi:hypothetical protein
MREWANPTPRRVEMLTSRAVLVTIAALLMLLLEPVVGGLVGLAATVVGLGALAVALWRARTPSGPATLEPSRPPVAA